MLQTSDLRRADALKDRKADGQTVYYIERPQSRVVFNENWYKNFCTTIVKRKIRKLGYVWGFAKKNVSAREVNKK